MLRVSQRQVVIGLFVLFIVTTLGIGVATFSTSPGSTTALNFVLTLVYVGLLVAYMRGFDAARYIQIVLVTGAAVALTPPTLAGTNFSLWLLVPIVMTQVLAGPLWVLGVASYVIVVMGVRATLDGVPFFSITLIAFVMIVGGLVLSQLILASARLDAEQLAKQAEDTLAQNTQALSEIERQSSELRDRNEEQRRLLDLVNTLEAPAVTLADGVLLAPLVGAIDSRRAAMLNNRLLQQVHSQRIRLVILDLTGVAMVDTAVAKLLIDTAESLRLLGCQVVISGISAEIAAILTRLEINFNRFPTVRSPQEALRLAHEEVLATNRT